ncbi:ComEC/Rec2 family competence protein [Tautonia sociabilis]|uniref:Competence protein ComEC n=1 Tax=Tautonia sociabilis TaxID=2080755 RepID=A0A432MFF5_9BACT|nr:MBL fold metallo-hydrolase [Tautonia sociabilis]RUL84613.1 competence protein ComEC [Tautonia sociabilis]
MANIAKEVIWPKDPNILVRVVFLHVGQGSSTIVLAADGSTYKSLLVDINLDASCDGIDVPRLMKDLLGDAGLDVFVNSHPHDDHLCGVKALSDSIAIKEVWHSGHVPGRDNEEAYRQLQEVIKKVTSGGGKEEELCGSRSPRPVGEAECYVLAPAQHVKDSIDDETAEVRRRRIHEHCAVLKFGSGSTWVMLPGDADRDAWEKWITRYHNGRLPAVVLAGSHHGSRTFFYYNDGDEPYKAALKAIAPDYVVLSAPRHSESRHKHPHPRAVDFYAEEVGRQNILHTGENRYCFICDIFRNGTYYIDSDKGELVEAYPIEDKKDGGGGNGSSGKPWAAPAVITRVDHRPMGSRSR